MEADWILIFVLLVELPTGVGYLRSAMRRLGCMRYSRIRIVFWLSTLRYALAYLPDASWMHKYIVHKKQTTWKRKWCMAVRNWHCKMRTLESV